MKLAHLTSDMDSREQSIIEHLQGVAEKARGFSVDLLKDYAFITGMAHDIGKYAVAFQDKLLGGKESFEHSVCGAIELEKLAKTPTEKNMTYMLEYCVAGHHTGLPDGGNKADNAVDGTTLHAKLKRKDSYIGKADYSSYKEEVEFCLPDYSELIKELAESKSPNEIIEKYAFFTRYLFSCLKDADCLDTEEFCNPDVDRKLLSDFEKAQKALDDKLAGFKAETRLQKARNALQKDAMKNSLQNTGISFLNMPTGSGKTLCSMKIALNKLKGNNPKKRIIYVIPFTSIIEQTAEVFDGIFGECVDILQHHSNCCYDEQNSTSRKLALSTENWDAPIIITTSVQFFQSLYHYKTSGLRKLHNMANSVIIFDEIHMIPVNHLQPCIRGIGYITKYLNSEAIFLSATMPDYSALLNKYANGTACVDLLPDKSGFSAFKKCRYSFVGRLDFQSVAQKASEYESSLIIVNKRKTAREMYGLLQGRKFHLSTYMTPNDRLAVIKEIRSCLENNEKITVVSTSLVEAGVDLDFKCVFRELAGFDSILQSGGRCNREGKYDFGDVFVFETDEKSSDEINIRASIVRDLIDSKFDIDSNEAVEEYYKRLFMHADEIIEKNTIANGVVGFDSIPFRSYAESFEYIKDDSVGVVINNCEKTESLLLQLENGKRSARRELQRYSVSVKIKGEFENALKKGLLKERANGVFVLTDNSYYEATTGLDINKEIDLIFD